MSQKEVDRAMILCKVQEEKITLRKASRLLNVSYSHAKRLYASFVRRGAQGLISKKRGVPSNRAVSESKQKVILAIIRKNYEGCAPLFITEKLEQYHGIKYSSEFIRKLMIKNRLWFAKEKKKIVHQRRLRRESEGELVQVDASDHDWFEGRGPRCHLHIYIDDATSKIQSGYFDLEETTKGYYEAGLSYFKKKGRPIGIYSDKRGVFRVNQGSSKGETQFSRAMGELGIKIIFAHTPQAKGRVERAFKTLQQRLIWEMRIRDISSIEEANAYLPHFLKEHNKRYSKPAASPIDVHRPLPKLPLEHILCVKEQRKVSKNLEVQYNNQFYQLKPIADLHMRLKGAKVTIIKTLNNELLFTYQETIIDYVNYSEIEYKKAKTTDKELLIHWKKRQKRKPGKYHPWK